METSVEIQVEFIEKDTGKKNGLIFYGYEHLGKWIADNYDSVEVLDITQSEE